MKPRCKMLSGPGALQVDLVAKGRKMALRLRRYSILWSRSVFATGS